MPFQPLGKFQQQLGKTFGAGSERRPFTFYDRVTFEGATGRVEIINGDLQASGNFSLGGNVTISGTLTVSGTSTLSGDTTMSGDLTLSGSAAIIVGTSLEITTDQLLFGPSQQGSMSWDSGSGSVRINSSNIILGSLTGEHIQIYNGDVAIAADAGTTTGITFIDLAMGTLNGENGHIRDEAGRLRRYVSDESYVASGNDDYYSSMNIDITQRLRYPDAQSGTTTYSDLNVLRSKVDGHYTVEPMVDSYGAAPVVNVFINDDTYAGDTTIYGTKVYLGDGGTLYADNNDALIGLNEAQASNGSSSDPSFTFTSDTTEGMYFDGSRVLITQESWTVPTLLNSWVDYGSGEQGIRYRMDVNGTVYVQGVIKSGTVTSGTNILQLPVGYRPAGHLQIAGVANNAFCSMKMQSDGYLKARTGWSATWTAINFSFPTV